MAAVQVAAETAAPLRVTVTGAVGNIGYALVFMIAQGRALGPSQPVILHLLDLPPMADKLEALKMELNDCALPLVHGIVTATTYEEGFKNTDVAILVGARPRGPGMLRKDLLAANAKIFQGQGAALAAHASADVKVLVVGNPCCTNALITATTAGELPIKNVTAMTRLDQNRCAGAIAGKLEVPVSAVSGVVVWGNHSATQVPDARLATVCMPGSTEVKGVRGEAGDDEWLLGGLVSATQQRGKAVIDKRGASSAGSAASAICDHVRDWFLGSSTPVSMAVPTDGSYGVPAGLVCSFPVSCSGGWQYSIDTTVPVDDWLQGALDASVAELQEEKALAFATA